MQEAFHAGASVYGPWLRLLTHVHRSHPLYYQPEQLALLTLRPPRTNDTQTENASLVGAATAKRIKEIVRLREQTCKFVASSIIAPTVLASRGSRHLYSGTANGRKFLVSLMNELRWSFTVVYSRFLRYDVAMASAQSEDGSASAMSPRSHAFLVPGFDLFRQELGWSAPSLRLNKEGSNRTSCALAPSDPTISCVHQENAARAHRQITFELDVPMCV